MRGRIMMAAVAALIVTTATACGSGNGQWFARGAGSATPQASTPPPTVHSPQVPALPPDTQAATADAAAARIKPCDLIDLRPWGGAGPGQASADPNADVHSDKPTDCDADLDDGVGIYIAVMTNTGDTKNTGHIRRWDGSPVVIAGHRAYVQDQTIDNTGPSCSVDLPMSFNDEITIDADFSQGIGPKPSGTVCQAAEAEATSVMTTLGSMGLPQPVFYPPNEPDDPEPGACADEGDPNPCVPYQPSFVGPMPATLASVPAFAKQDDAYNCAISLAAVRQVFGQQMQPVIDGGACRFVESNHVVELSVSATDEQNATPRKLATSVAPIWNVTPRTVMFAGNPAEELTQEPNSDTGYEMVERDVYVSTGHDIDRPGFIDFDVRISNPRGTSDSTHADLKLIPKLDQVVSLVVSRYPA